MPVRQAFPELPKRLHVNDGNQSFFGEKLTRCPALILITDAIWRPCFGSIIAA